MGNQSTKEALIADVKREVLMDLNRTNWRPHFVESIKQEILMDLGYHPRPPFPDSTLRESLKNEILEQIRRETEPGPGDFRNPYYPDRAGVESIKREVIAQIEAERGAWGRSYAGKKEKD